MANDDRVQAIADERTLHNATIKLASRHLAKIQRLEVELVAVRSQIDRVRAALHRRDERGFCIECTDAGVMPWPCDTITAIDQPEGDR